MGDGQTCEPAAALPAQLVILAFELRHLRTATGEHQHSLAVAHQLRADVRFADHRAGGSQQIGGKAPRVGE